MPEGRGRYRVVFGDGDRATIGELAEETIR